MCRTLPYVADEYQPGIFRPIGRVKRRWLWFLSLLWPRHHRVFANELVAQYCGFEQVIAPLPFDTEPVFLEARLYAQERHDRRQRRPLFVPIETGTSNSASSAPMGAGQPTATPLPGFSTGALLNGWSCVSHRCSLLEPHYCGRCHAELRGVFADDPSEAP